VDGSRLVVGERVRLRESSMLVFVFERRSTTRQIRLGTDAVEVVAV
jgi:hypothetical protein